MKPEDSLLRPEEFWSQQSNLIDWIENFETTLETWEDELPTWFSDGKINICHLAVDRHVENGNGDKIALHFNSPMTQIETKYSFADIQKEVSKLAGGLINLGVEKGDRVVLFMPMIPQTYFAMLACARIGAVHVNIFGGFAANELAMRIDDSQAKVLITATSAIEEGRLISYKPIVDEAIKLAHHKPEKVVVFQRKLGAVLTKTHRFVDYRNLVDKSDSVECQSLNSNDPLYIIYASGASGKPKGIVRDHGSYAVGLAYSMQNQYNISNDDVVWAASDVNWIAGHSYSLYGPLINGNTSIILEGKPISTPDHLTYWRIIEKYKVTSIFASISAFRLIKTEEESEDDLRDYNLDSLNKIVFFGEKLNTETIKWLKAKGSFEIFNAYIQSESGISLFTNKIERISSKNIDCIGKAIEGLEYKIFDEKGNELDSETEGYLALKLPLPPGGFTGIYNNP